MASRPQRITHRQAKGIQASRDPRDGRGSAWQVCEDAPPGWGQGGSHPWPCPQPAVGSSASVLPSQDLRGRTRKVSSLCFPKRGQAQLGGTRAGGGEQKLLWPMARRKQPAKQRNEGGEGSRDASHLQSPGGLELHLINRVFFIIVF